MSEIRTVTIELAYEDALRLWTFVNAPGDVPKKPHRADARIRKFVNDAIKTVEDDYAEADDRA